jgi:hypothetical protein
MRSRIWAMISTGRSGAEIDLDVWTTEEEREGPLLSAPGETTALALLGTTTTGASGAGGKSGEGGGERVRVDIAFEEDEKLYTRAS